MTASTRHEANPVTVANTWTVAQTFNEIITASKGITFPATQVPSADVNTLDDYEEGPWTPAVAFSVSLGDALTGTTIAQGDYVKIGKQVTIQCFLRFTEGSASGTITLTGMPFAHSSTSRDDTASSFLPGAITSLVDGGLILYDSANVMYVAYANAGVWTLVSNTQTSTNSTIQFTHTYFTD